MCGSGTEAEWEVLDKGDGIKKDKRNKPKKKKQCLELTTITITHTYEWNKAAHVSWLHIKVKEGS